MTRTALVAAMAALCFLCGCAEDPIPKLSDDLEELDLNTRLTAVARLRDLNDDRAIDLLAEALESDEELTDAAGLALAYKGRKLKTDEKPDKVNEALTRLMKNTHLDEPPRAKAAWALGEIGDRESIPALKAARSAVDAKAVAAKDVREQAVQALEKLGFYTVGRAMAMTDDGKVADPALDGTPKLDQPTAPTATPEAAEAEAGRPAEGAEKPAEGGAAPEKPAAAGEAEAKPAAPAPAKPSSPSAGQ